MTDSPEGQIIAALLDLEGEVYNGCISNKDIMNKVNSDDRPTRYRISSNMVGKRMVGLGFQRSKSGNSRGYFYNRERVLDYAKKYGLLSNELITKKGGILSKQLIERKKRCWHYMALCLHDNDAGATFSELLAASESTLEHASWALQTMIDYGYVKAVTSKTQAMETDVLVAPRYRISDNDDSMTLLFDAPAKLFKQDDDEHEDDANTSDGSSSDEEVSNDE